MAVSFSGAHQKHDVPPVENPDPFFFKPTILIVEDDLDQMNTLKHFFHKERYPVLSACSGDEAIWTLRKLAGKKTPVVSIIDLILPDLSGADLCHFIRNHQDLRRYPIMAISALAQPEIRISILEEGADDFMIKPFSPREMLARIKALIRRCQQQQETQEKKAVTLSLGLLNFNSLRRSLTLSGKSVSLTKIEFSILEYLISHLGRAITKEELLSVLWGDETPVGDNNLKVHIYALRKKLQDPAEKPRFIETLRGLGYRFRDQWEDS